MFTGKPLSCTLSPCCRSVSSSRSQSQAVNVDTRSVPTMSTIVDDVDKPDEADETSSFRSMSSTTSTNYGAPKYRPSATPLYTIPDEAAVSEDGSKDESSSQSETEAAQDLPASAAVQALHQEADDLMLSRQHASSSASSLADASVDPASGSENKSHAPGKSLGSNQSFSEASELCPVSETESSRRTTSNGDDEGSRTVGQNATPVVVADADTQQLPSSPTHQAGTSAGTTPSLSISTANQHSASYPLSQGAMAADSVSVDPDSMHTPRAMGPPATPDAPLVPKIDAGPAESAPSGVSQLHADAKEQEANLDGQEGQTMFAGLDIM